MQFWKSFAIGLIVLLGISYVGFAYVYSLTGGITMAGMVTDGKQSKVITLLTNSNITNLGSWNTSVDVQGYRTGFLFCKCSKTNVPYSWSISISVAFETDGIIAGDTGIGELSGPSRGVAFGEVNLGGTRMWVFSNTAYSEAWAVVSVSLYLRD